MPEDSNTDRLWREPWCRARLLRGQWLKREHPFSTARTATRLNARTVDGNLVGRRYRRRERIPPDAFSGPAMIAIVDRRIQTVFGGATVVRSAPVGHPKAEDVPS